MNTLYANGDSFVFGMECMGDGNKSEANKDLAFAQHIAQSLDCEHYINNAYNGATNEFIFRSTILDLIARQQAGHKPEDTFVVIGWTSLHRFEISADGWFNACSDGARLHVDPSISEYADYGTLFVNPHSNVWIAMGSDKPTWDTEQDIAPFLARYVWHDHMQAPQQEVRVIALKSWLEQQGYKYIFLNMCGDHNTCSLDTGPGMYKLNTESFYDWSKQHHPTGMMKNNHFGPDVHRAYGAMLVEYIKERIIC
jgi:hypothetical protein